MVRRIRSACPPVALGLCLLQACASRAAQRETAIYVPTVATYPAYAPAYTPAYDGFQPAAGIVAHPAGQRPPPRTLCTNLGDAMSCTSW